jgi:hypothetical protein
MKKKIEKTRKSIILIILLMLVGVLAAAIVFLGPYLNSDLLIATKLVEIGALAAFLYIAVFSVAAVDGDFTERRLRKIFCKYGSRMVAINGEFPENASYRYQVKSLEDLVKLSIVIQKPLLYGYRDETKDITKFCVLDQDILYYWNPWWYEVEVTNYPPESEEAEQVPTEYTEYIEL